MSQTFVAPDGKVAFNDSQCFCGGQWASGTDEKGPYKYYHKKVGGYYRLHQIRRLKNGNPSTPVEEKEKEVNMNLFGSVKEGIMNILPRLLATPRLEVLCKAFLTELMNEETKTVEDEKLGKLELLNAEADLLYKKIAHESKKIAFLESLKDEWIIVNPTDYKKEKCDMNDLELDNCSMYSAYQDLIMDESRVVSKLRSNDLHEIETKYKKEDYEFKENHLKMSHLSCDDHFEERQFMNKLIKFYDNSLEYYKKKRDYDLKKREESKQREEFKNKIKAQEQYINEQLLAEQVKRDEEVKLVEVKVEYESEDENDYDLRDDKELSEEEKKQKYKKITDRFVKKYEYDSKDRIEEQYREYREILSNIETNKSVIKDQVKKLKKDFPELKKKEIDESLENEYDEVKTLEEQLPRTVKELKISTEQAIDYYLDIGNNIELLKENHKDTKIRAQLLAELTKSLQFVYSVRFEIIQVYINNLTNSKAEIIKEMDSKRNKDDRHHYQKEIDIINKKIEISQNEFNVLKTGKLQKSVKEPELEENNRIPSFGLIYYPTLT